VELHGGIDEVARQVSRLCDEASDLRTANDQYYLRRGSPSAKFLDDHAGVSVYEEFGNVAFIQPSTIGPNELGDVGRFSVDRDLPRKNQCWAPTFARIGKRSAILPPSPPGQVSG
jgi:hypothetical protein